MTGCAKQYLVLPVDFVSRCLTLLVSEEICGRFGSNSMDGRLHIALPRGLLLCGRRIAWWRAAMMEVSASLFVWTSVSCGD